MSTNHTKNYNLSQWEADDQVLRVEFNEDNSKIDAAIAERLGRIEIIRELSFPKSQQEVRQDMTGFDWDQWSVVGALLLNDTDKDESHSSSIFTLGCPLTGTGSSAYAYRTPGPQMILLFPRHSANGPVSVLTFPGGDIGWSDQDYTTINTLWFGSNYGSSISKRAHFYLFGIR